MSSDNWKFEINISALLGLVLAAAWFGWHGFIVAFLLSVPFKTYF